MYGFHVSLNGSFDDPLRRTTETLKNEVRNKLERVRDRLRG